MAFRRKGRRPKVVWLPVLGTSSDPAVEDAELAMGSTVQLTIPSDGSIGWDAQPVTFDASNPASINQFPPLDSFPHTLHDLVSGNGYRLRRLVGKCFVGAGGAPLAANTDATWVDVAAGFMVVRTDDSGNPTTDFDEVNPLAQDSANDPWIWRRRWLLNPYVGQRFHAAPGLGTTGALLYEWPATNVQYGSVQDGPHIDQKTARLIGPEERLFFIIAARGTLGGADVPANWEGGQVQCLLDLRILASMRSMVGNRRNASR